MQYVIRNSPKLEHSVDIYIPEEWVGISIASGISIKTKLPEIVFFVKKINKLPDFIPNIWGYLVLNEKAVEVIKEICPKDEIEFLPCVIQDKLKKNSILGYYIGNIIQSVAGIDMDRSKLEVTPGGNIISIDKIVVKNANIRDKNIFRMKEFMSLICCSQAFVDNINNNKLSGIIFKPLTEYII